MRKALCHICLNTGRPVRFITSRIQICQWCVTFLSDKPINPTEIREHLLGIAASYIEVPPERPDKAEIFEQGRKLVESRHSLAQNIFHSLFKKDDRKRQIHDAANLILEKANNEYNHAISDYQQRRPMMLAQKYEQLISGEFIPRKLTSFFAKRSLYAPPWSPPIRSAYKDVLTKQDRDYLKYVRAFRLNLLAGKEKQERLDEEEMSLLRGGVREADGDTCKICGAYGRKVEKHVHHIIPLDKFGSNHPNNLITLCYPCHNKLHPGMKVTRNL